MRLPAYLGTHHAVGIASRCLHSPGGTNGIRPPQARPQFVGGAHRGWPDSARARMGNGPVQDDRRKGRTRQGRSVFAHSCAAGCRPAPQSRPTRGSCRWRRSTAGSPGPGRWSSIWLATWRRGIAGGPCSHYWTSLWDGRCRSSEGTIPMRTRSSIISNRPKVPGPLAPPRTDAAA
jgi:hypothetical protein